MFRHFFIEFKKVGIQTTRPGSLHIQLSDRPTGVRKAAHMYQAMQQYVVKSLITSSLLAFYIWLTVFYLWGFIDFAFTMSSLTIQTTSLSELLPVLWENGYAYVRSDTLYIYIYILVDNQFKSEMTTMFCTNYILYSSIVYRSSIRPNFDTARSITDRVSQQDRHRFA